MDWIVPEAMGVLPQPASGGDTHGESGWLSNISAVLLLLVLAFSYWSSSRRRAAAKANRTGGHFNSGVKPAERHELVVNGMTCNRCVGIVKRGLTECAGVESADVYLADGRGIVTGNGIDRNQLITAVTELGYTAELIEHSH
jgi:copper chaperone CopZ